MLEIKNLSITYKTDESETKAVNGVSLSITEGETLGLLGESGSGKSTIGLAIMRLLPQNAAIQNGEILFDGNNLLDLSEKEMQKLRGAQISMIFQDPFTSLNPVYTVGDQIAEAIILHQGVNKKDAWQKAVEMLEFVQIKEPALRIKDYPHQFSGGMRQRVMIAMMLACRPKLLIADEPTTALDVTIQAEILELLQKIQKQMKLSIIFITHNFGIAANFCSKVLVMQKGRVVESGATTKILQSPAHPYTQRLIECVRFFNG